MATCILCGRKLLGRGHRHDGQYIAQWNVDVCEPCFEASYQGVALSRHPQLAHHLNEQGIKVELNTFGNAEWPSIATPPSRRT